ncbi:hypothetical protein ASPCADRAFT_3139 [Aspergillus carbonarius ITEM 5010]|uniref:Aminoglycoside phosphotransferase domain-containing protein n=1 Tax=Aspergillus carbonarius (strain ITEM 5010) TaxID=602072 RepID=A0A1R3RUE4_ASPC5|nr:hypothetical protein ASPCADRAFT_3139 [Aspergillus carbonarius ITEM 5010]
MDRCEGFPILETKPEILSKHAMRVTGGTMYRVKIDDQLKYVCVLPRTFHESETMAIPSFEDNEGANMVRLWRGEDGNLQYEFQIWPGLPQKRLWHPDQFDWFDLHEVERITENVSVVTTAADSRTCIAKVKVVEVQLIEFETMIYRLFKDTGLTPTFLGHIYEADRVIGFLLEKVEENPPLRIDFEACKKALQRLHEYKLCLGDVTKDNFLVQSDGTVKLIGFAQCETCLDSSKIVQQEIKMQQEIENLRWIFTE